MTERKSKLGWIPNLFTLGNLWFGFFAILFAMQGRTNPELLNISGAFILLAFFFDGFDGYTARLLHAQSELGAQLDSLADLTTFGVAPAVLIYSLVLNEFNWYPVDNVVIPTGMILSAIYPACAAYRLARFNVAHSSDSFVGLPSPVAGLLIALMPITFSEQLTPPSAFLATLFIILAFLMVSTIRYEKPQVRFLKTFSLVRGIIALIAVFIGLIFLWVRYGPDFAAAGIFTLMLLYIVSGLVAFIIHTIQEARV